MPQTIDAADLGLLEFPDDASPDEITKAVQALYARAKQVAVAPRTITPEGMLMDPDRPLGASPTPDESIPEGMHVAPGEAPLTQLPWTQVPAGQTLHALSTLGNIPGQEASKQIFRKVGPNGTAVPLTDEEAGKSVIPGLPTPEQVHANPGDPLGIPSASVVKAGLGLGHFMTSPHGLTEMGTAMTPAAPVVIGKWTLDMLDGLNRSVHDAMTAAKTGDKQQLSDALANTALFGTGIASIAHGIHGLAESPGGVKPSESVSGGIEPPPSNQSAANVPLPNEPEGYKPPSAPSIPPDALEKLRQELEAGLQRNQIVKSPEPENVPRGTPSIPSAPETLPVTQDITAPLPPMPETPPATPGEVIAKAVEEQPLKPTEPQKKAADDLRLTITEGLGVVHFDDGSGVKFTTPWDATGEEVRQAYEWVKRQPEKTLAEWKVAHEKQNAPSVEGAISAGTREALPAEQTVTEPVTKESGGKPVETGPFPYRLLNSLGDATLERIIQQELEQHKEFVQATSEGKMRIAAEDLQPGDTLHVEGENLKVIDRNEHGDVTVEDGTRFGKQVLRDGQHIYVEKVEEHEPAQVTGEPLFGPPESVEEQKARMEQESAQQQKKAQREELLQRQQKPLVGSQGDIGQRDLLSGQPGGKAQEDLFSAPTPKTKVENGNELVQSGKVNPEQDYRGLHQAPDRESGSPLHDLSNTYPEDVYSPKATQYYGHHGGNHPMDAESVRIIQEYRGKPTKPVKIYRAVPEVLTNDEQMARYEGEKRYILKNGKMPPDADAHGMDRSRYYEWVSGEIDRLKTAPEKSVPEYKINSGDWVTINRNYAKEHGASQFGRDFKILSKTVPAEDIFTNGDSIHEWGYDPSKAASKAAPDAVENWLDKAIEKTDPTTWRGETSLGLARLPVWLTKQVAHDALKVVRAAYRASKDVLSALKAGVDHIRQFNLPGFNEDQARRWLRAGLPEKGSLATLDNLTDYLRTHEIDSPRMNAQERIKSAYDSVKATIGATGDTVKAAWARSAALFSSMWQAYKLPVPVGSDFRNIVKQWHAMNTRTLYQAYQFSKTLRSRIPNAARRAGITVWLQAGGDHATLASQLAAVPDKYKPVWKAAMDLTPDELDIADQIKADWADKLRKGVNAGLVDQAHKDYAPQVWKKAPQVQPTLDENNPGSPTNKLDTRKPFFYYEKSVPNYYEGIMAKGVPRSLDVADLVGYYQAAFNKAISSRAVVKLLNDAKAADRKPVTVLSGRAEKVPNDTGGESYLVNPNYKAAAVSADGRPYRAIDHPALQDWKWVNSTDEGDILMKGDMLVHPDHYEFLKNVLGTSAFREGKLGAVVKPVLAATRFLKESKFALAPFHVATEGLHSLSHLVSPLLTGSDRIDFRDPVQARLTRGGLDLGMNDAYSLFTDGLSANGGIYKRIPGIGKLVSGLSDWTFKDYIPRLKMKVAQAMLERNTKRYAGKLSQEDIDELSAKQANSAFGGLNYRLMGDSLLGNPTARDFLRMALLAPDFFMSRAKVVGQALKPYGAEQRKMILVQAATTYIGFRILNSLLDDDNDPHWNDPFAVYHGGRRYSLRTITGDVANLIKDPRAFAYGRMAPLTHLVTEVATGRDWRGIKRTSIEQLGDFMRWFLPVGVEGIVPGEGHPETTAGSAALQAVGLGSRQASAYQRVKDLARDFNRNSPDPAVRKQQDRDDRESHMSSDYKRLDNALQSNDLERAKKEYQQLLDDGKKPEKIAQRYSHDAGFTGSKHRDQQFIATLTPAQRTMMERAKAEKSELYQRFLQVR